MLRYLLRRLLLLVPMIFAASVIIFAMLRLGTGDPALDYLRLSTLPPTTEMVASTRAMLGLDQPLVIQYGTWLWKAMQLDFGAARLLKACVARIDFKLNIVFPSQALHERKRLLEVVGRHDEIDVAHAAADRLRSERKGACGRLFFLLWLEKLAAQAQCGLAAQNA